METFKKRQKEMRRLERQRDKAARRVQRKQNREAGIVDAPPDDGLPDDTLLDDGSSATPDGSPAVAPPTEV
jgi:hypothetical protein